ncbi:MAG: hypothetical protein ACRYGA_15350 [Janthinobacterium lividum]
MLVRWQRIGIASGVRYALGGCALVLAAIGVYVIPDNHEHFFG